MPDIATEVANRGITRLCHFTHLSSFPKITKDRAILSSQILAEKRPDVVRNDRNRLDGHLNHVSCSVQFPNLWVLDSYREAGSKTDEWLVLLLDRKLLSLPSTRFSPVNAATARGAHVTDGPEGFTAIFQPQPPSVHYVYRGQSHLKSCPTDNQAEVLVHQAVLADEIIGVVCMTSEAQQQVDQFLAVWNKPKPKSSVREVLFESDYVKNRIWSGNDLDLAVREV